MLGPVMEQMSEWERELEHMSEWEREQEQMPGWERQRALEKVMEPLTA